VLRRPVESAQYAAAQIEKQTDVTEYWMPRLRGA
jgi:hypothetical protein